MRKESGKRWEETRKAWDQVGEQVTDVGRRVGEHYRKLREGSSREEPSEREVEGAIARVVRQMDQTFTSLGNTLRDPEAQKDMGQAARSLADALSATFTELRGVVKKEGNDEEGGGG